MTRSLPLVVCAVFLLSAHAALAKPKVAVLRIEGDASGDVRDAVTEALGGKELSVIPSKEVNRAVEKLGEPDELTEPELRTLSIELAADGVVAARLDAASPGKPGKPVRTLKFRLYIHKQLVKGFTVSFKDPKSEKFRTMLHDKIVDRFATAMGEKAKPDDEEVADATDADAAPARPGKVAAARESSDARDASDAGGARVETDARPGPRAAPERKPNQPMARVELGASLQQRSYTFDATNIVGKPNDYAGSAPGVRFAAELYPTAYSDPSGALARFGVAVAYDKSFGLTAPTLTMGLTVPVKQSSYSIGVRYRWALGAAPASPTLTFGLDFAKRLFSPDRSGLTDPAVNDSVLRDSPNTNYALVEPGAAFRLPVTPRIAVALGVQGLVVLDAGGIQSNSSYGQAQVFGIDGTAAVDVMVTRRFVVRLAGEFSQIGYSFTGLGARSGNVDGDPTTKDVAGLTDRAIGGSATLGVVY